MPVIVLVVIVVAWAALLGPSLLRRRAQGGIGSIHNFHHQLEVLEHSGPAPIVSPAYRLRVVDEDGSLVRMEPVPVGAPSPKITVVGAKDLPRPALAFLGGEEVVHEVAEPDAVESHGHRDEYDEWDEYDRFEPHGSEEEARREAYHRQVTRQRRRDTLIALTAVFVGTLVIGLIPGASLAWTISAVTGCILVAYVALLINLRRRADERERKLHYLAPSREAQLVHAPRTDLPARVSGRYAHPSNQTAISR